MFALAFPFTPLSGNAALSMLSRCPLCAADLAEGAPAAPAQGSEGMCPACGRRRFARPANSSFAREGDIEDAVILSEEPPPARSARRSAHSSAAVAPGMQAHVPSPRPSAEPARTLLLACTVAVFTFVAVLTVFLPGIRASASSGQLAFQKVRTERVDIAGRPALMVEGEIINRSGRFIAVPSVRVLLKTPQGQVVRTELVQPGIAALAPGETAGFRRALASPPAHATQVTLDLAGGARSRPGENH